ncbi:unnamed protein product [Vitrella brassicaformis CCMP3155]|uniref:PUB domain-containing protein n=1 Tax=Vitrella brassicaformis (strain CCMP3155) TaxID=1169540 RepID=A0A0G4FB87_VITBC|nr:unnamed protein product [Vitrella brassicaformis CCMP3155]|eukprot:CEM10150.1 unnamed protein product [Vitrella brassicaformis CCMP3155]
MQKFRKKIAEKDPDKKTYGPAMQQKIEALLEEFDGFLEVFAEQIQPRFEHQLKRLRQQEASEAAKAAEASKEQEQAAIRQQLADTEKEEQERLAKKQQRDLEAKQREDDNLSRERRLQEEELEREAARQKLLLDMADTQRALESQPYHLIVLEGLTKMGSGLPLSAMRQTVDALCELIGGISQTPDVLAMRVLRLQNQQFQSSIGSRPGSLQILQAVGFRLKTADEIRPLLGQLKQEGTVDPMELYLVMQEPNIVEQYDTWQKWMDGLSRVRDYLLALKQQLTRMALPSSGQEGASGSAAISRDELQDLWDRCADRNK